MGARIPRGAHAPPQAKRPRAAPSLIGLAGPRLRLREWREADLEPLAAINGDAAVMRWFVKPLDRAESDAFAARMIAHQESEGFSFLPVCRQDDDTLIGVVGLLRMAWEAPFSPGVEIGWRIAPDHQGLGYASEAAALCLRFGFEMLGLPEIVAFAVPGNSASRRVMAKLGMAEQGRFIHPRIPEGHAFREQVWTRITAAEWRAAQAA
jgi:RimJ/RimL family protein N-acetyltransferase